MRAICIPTPSPLWHSLLSAAVFLLVGWLAIFLYALVTFGKRGFWVLLGGAPALWVIFIFLAIPFACAFKHDCL